MTVSTPLGMGIPIARPDGKTTRAKPWLRPMGVRPQQHRGGSEEVAGQFMNHRANPGRLLMHWLARPTFSVRSMMWSQVVPQ